MKEAYVKAMGSGLSHGLDKVEFHHTAWTDISAKIDGEALIEWRFWLFELEKRHWVSPSLSFVCISISSLNLVDHSVILLRF